MVKKIISFIVCIAISALLFVPGAFALNYNKNMLAKVGLVYGDEAKDNYNVFYDAGGMHFGYMSGDNANVVYESDARFVSVANDKSYSLSGNSLLSGSAIGAYHVQLDAAYYSQSEADSAAYGVSGFVAYVEGIYRVRFGSYSSLDDAQDAAFSYAAETGQAAAGVGGTSYGFSVIDMNEGKVIFELELSNADTFYLDPVNHGEKPQMRNGSTDYYGSFLMYRTSSGKMNLINLLPVQDYLKGVLPYEMSTGWPIEALKAQAVAARNYLYQNMNKHASQGFMVCDNTHCQMYGGTARAGTSTDAAVDQTDGMVLTYNGKLAELYYHASSGGYTENSENVWLSAVPYLVAVESPYEDLDKAYNGRWTYTLTKEQVREKLIAGGYSIGEIESFYVSKFTDAGNVYSVTATDTSGNSVTITKETVRIKLSPYVHSMRFTISGTGNLTIFARSAGGNTNLSEGAFTSSVIDAGTGISQISSDSVSVITDNGTELITKNIIGSNTFVISGTGNGNNVGLSQEGAKGMALAGFTFDQILTHYFQGTQIEYLN